MHPFYIEYDHRQIVRVISDSFKVAQNIDKDDAGSRTAAACVEPSDVLGAQRFLHVVDAVFKVDDLLRKLRDPRPPEP